MSDRSSFFAGEAFQSFLGTIRKRYNSNRAGSKTHASIYPLLEELDRGLEEFMRRSVDEELRAAEERELDKKSKYGRQEVYAVRLYLSDINNAWPLIARGYVGPWISGEIFCVRGHVLDELDKKEVQYDSVKRNAMTIEEIKERFSHSPKIDNTEYHGEDMELF